MASIQDLFSVFQSFCNFGSSRNLATGSVSEGLNGPQMDNSKFAKFCKDTKIVDNKKVTVTDVDIMFNKAKAKGARKLDWEAFQGAFQMLAEQKFPNKSSKECHLMLLDHIVDKGPVARGTVTKADGIYSKLTDTTLYTGSHKSRFDEDGVGRGKAGRKQLTGTTTLSELVNRSSSNVAINRTSVGATGGTAKKRGQANIVTASTEGLDLVSKPVKKQDQHLSNTTLAAKKTVVVESRPKTPKSVSTSTPNLARPTSATKPKTSAGGGVFDRLTNVNGYTGAHKHRFNADGSGRGITGRDAPSLGKTPGAYRGGDVKDLSQILRS